MDCPSCKGTGESSKPGLSCFECNGKGGLCNECGEACEVELGTCEECVNAGGGQ